eukprot:6340346-Amphidinium_carterae.1
MHEATADAPMDPVATPAKPTTEASALACLNYPFTATPPHEPGSCMLSSPLSGCSGKSVCWAARDAEHEVRTQKPNN